MEKKEDYAPREEKRKTEIQRDRKRVRQLDQTSLFGSQSEKV